MKFTHNQAKDNPPGMGARGGFQKCYHHKQQSNYIPQRRQRPAYARQFRPQPGGQCFLFYGWPGRGVPILTDTLVIDDEVHVGAYDLSGLVACHVFVMPAPGKAIYADDARDLGRALVAASVASVAMMSEAGIQIWPSKLGVGDDC